MDKQTMRSKIINSFAEIAPEIEEIQIDDRTDIREQLDLDSVDMMNCIIKIEEDFSIEIENQDYPLFMTLEGAMSFIAERV